MKKIIISIFITGIVIFCNAQTKTEVHNSNTRQTEVMHSVNGADKYSKETNDKQITTAQRTDDTRDAIPAQAEKSKNNRTSKNNPSNRKREDN